VRAELELSVFETKTRRSAEAVVGRRIIELIARSIDIEVIEIAQALWVRQKHDSNVVCAQSIFSGPKLLPCPPNGASAMTQSKLRGQHLDIGAWLFNVERFKRVPRLWQLAQMVRVDLAGAIVEKGPVAL
jgi:hypothetical protein